jgi:uncharacterized membrane protein YozB (DUF420 family)
MIQVPGRMTNQVLPRVNAFLNGSSAVLLALGGRLIHRGRRDAHRRYMLALLLIHAAPARVIVPLIFVTHLLALKGQFERKRSSNRMVPGFAHPVVAMGDVFHCIP